MEALYVPLDFFDSLDDLFFEDVNPLVELQLDGLVALDLLLKLGYGFLLLEDELRINLRLRR